MGKGRGKCGSVVDEKDLDEVDTKKLVVANNNSTTNTNNTTSTTAVNGTTQQRGSNNGAVGDQSSDPNKNRAAATTATGNNSNYTSQSTNNTTVVSPSQSTKSLSTQDKAGKGSAAGKTVDPEVAQYLSNVPLLGMLSTNYSYHVVSCGCGHS
jgi:hypothetical protein